MLNKNALYPSPTEDKIIMNILIGQNMFNIIKFYDIDIEFIRKYKNNFCKDCWNWISCKYKLDEDFIREFQNELDWRWISSDQFLSESFILEFINLIIPHKILTYQDHISNELRFKIEELYYIK